MNKLKEKIIVGFIIIMGIFGIINTTNASVISAYPQDKEFATGETFLVEVHLNSEKKVVNAVETTITYPTDLLEVVKVSQGGSFLNLWIQEPAVEESAGIISLSGGVPGGSLVLDGKIVTITFKTKTSGVGEVKFDQNNTKVLLNDGLGTVDNLKTISGIYTVSSNTFIEIESSTHPDENVWYQNNDFTVKWDLKKNAIYSYVLSNVSDENPDNNREATTGAVTFSDLSNGIFYFILSEKIEGGDWEIIGKRRAMIDSRSPLSIDAVISKEKTLYDGQYFLIFSTTDKGSGVDYYDIREGSEFSTKVSSPYILKDQTNDSLITIIAYDRAGNSIKKTLGIVPIGVSNSFYTDDTVLTLLLIVVFSIIILVLLYFAFKIRSQTKKEE